MADEHDRGWRARLARRRSTPDDEVRVRPMAAAGWMLATVLAVIGVTAGVWFWLRGKSDIELSAARIALTAGGGAGAGVGLMLAFRRQQHQEKATVLTDRDAVERRINDRYTAAIDQLGSDKLDVRLGGIYALERIAADSRRDHPTVIDVLCTFVREHTRPDASYNPDPVFADQSATDSPQPRAPIPSHSAADVQAALTVIRRRNSEYDTRFPDLHGADLRYAKLHGANLRGADLHGANLLGANLCEANLREAKYLRYANLRGANLRGANLMSASLASTDLTSVDMCGADLRGVDLRGAFLIDVDLRGANLRGADLRDTHMMDTTVRGARHNSATKWPEGFTPPPSAEQTDPPPGDADA